MSEKKIISWNVNGIRAVAKKDFLTDMPSWNADIVCLQETKAHKEQLDDTIVSMPGYHSYWHSAEKKGYSSVAIYSKEEPLRIIEGIGYPEFDCEGRVIIAEYSDFYVFCIYFPNAQAKIKRIDYRLAFGDALIQVLEEKYCDKTRVLCGDFNVAHKEIDLSNPKANIRNPGFSIEERDWFDKFLNLGYFDTFRAFNQEPEQYSWWSYRTAARTRNIGWRIDYFCVDSASQSRVKDASIMQEVMGSDHCPVAIVLD